MFAAIQNSRNPLLPRPVQSLPFAHIVLRPPREELVANKRERAVRNNAQQADVHAIIQGSPPLLSDHRLRGPDDALAEARVGRLVVHHAGADYFVGVRQEAGADLGQGGGDEPVEGTVGGILRAGDAGNSTTAATTTAVSAYPQLVLESLVDRELNRDVRQTE